MKLKILLFLSLVSFHCISANAQNSITRTYSVTSTGRQSSINVSSNIVTQWRATWKVNPTPATCSFQIDGSQNNITWPSSIISSTTCTSDGQAVFSGISTSSSYVSLNVTALSAGVTLTVTLDGSPNTTITSSLPNSLGASATTVSFTSTLGTTIFAVSTTPANLYAVHFYNGAATVCYIQLFDAATGSVTLGTTVPNDIIPMPTVSANYPTSSIPLRNYATAISAASTTTPTGNTICGTTSVVMFRYK